MFQKTIRRYFNPQLSSSTLKSSRRPSVNNGSFSKADLLKRTYMQKIGMSPSNQPSPSATSRCASNNRNKFFSPSSCFLHRKNINQIVTLTVLESIRAVDTPNISLTNHSTSFNHLSTPNLKLVRQASPRLSPQRFQVFVLVGKHKSSIMLPFGSVSGMIQTLSKGNHDIIGYRTVPENLEYDYLLTKGALSNSFLCSSTGQPITLTPVYRKVCPVINMNCFQIVKCIGVGGFSTVMLGRCLQDAQFYALKMISKSFIIRNGKQDLVANEKRVMEMMQHHPHLNSLRFAFETADYVVLALEYCAGGQLFQLLRKLERFEQSMARFYVAEILLGLESMHAKGIVNRDIKPENILLDDSGHIKMADFGLAKPGLSADRLADSFCGSPQYMAPEMIRKQGHTFPIDFYCLGIILYELVCGVPPYCHEDPQEIYKKTLAGVLPFPDNLDLSDECRHLILALTDPDPKTRLGSKSGVQEVLSHQWFQGFNIAKLRQGRIPAPYKPLIEASGAIVFRLSGIDLQPQKINKMKQILEFQKGYGAKQFQRMLPKDFYFDFRKNSNQDHSQQAADLFNQSYLKYMGKENERNDSKSRGNLKKKNTKVITSFLKKQPHGQQLRLNPNTYATQQNSLALRPKKLHNQMLRGQSAEQRCKYMSARQSKGQLLQIQSITTRRHKNTNKKSNIY